MPQPHETFSVALTREGVYDYYCIPHEHAGMVGRIVVGNPPTSPEVAASGTEPVPDVALRAFPPAEEILRHGLVRRSE